jgi:hypothetical protein
MNENTHKEKARRFVARFLTVLVKYPELVEEEMSRLRGLLLYVEKWRKKRALQYKPPGQRQSKVRKLNSDRNNPAKPNVTANNIIEFPLAGGQ